MRLYFANDRDIKNLLKTRMRKFGPIKSANLKTVLNVSSSRTSHSQYFRISSHLVRCVGKLPKWFGERPGKKKDDPETPEEEEVKKGEDDVDDEPNYKNYVEEDEEEEVEEEEAEEEEEEEEVRNLFRFNRNK